MFHSIVIFPILSDRYYSAFFASIRYKRKIGVNVHLLFCGLVLYIADCTGSAAIAPCFDFSPICIFLGSLYNAHTASGFNRPYIELFTAKIGEDDRGCFQGFYACISVFVGYFLFVLLIS